MEIFPLFSPHQLQELLTGRSSIDLEVLRRVTEYKNANESDPYVQIFWSALSSFDETELSKFLNFVSARSRLPANVGEFTMKLELIGEENDTKRLPKSQTCFNLLLMPRYVDVPTCRQKLLYAIYSTPNMDADFAESSADHYV